MTTNAEDLQYSVQDGIGYITFNRPDAHNAITFAMYERLAQICRFEVPGPRPTALIIAGAGGRAFSAGTDISQFLSFSGQQGLEYEDKMRFVASTIEECPVATIAAISGACTGGGAVIAACCDIRIGSASQRFGIPIARTLGNCLSLENYARLANIIGPARLVELIFSARLLDGEESLRVGWLSEVLTDETAVVARATEIARGISAMAPLSIWATKTALQRIREKSLQGQDADLIQACYESKDFAEGVRAFLEKRPPLWSGA